MEGRGLHFKDVLFIVLGSCIYAFGLITFNIANDLIEGDVMRTTLTLRALSHFNPTYMTLLINIPLLLTGGKILGKRSPYYTLIGTVSLSVFSRFWQKFPVEIDLSHDLLIATPLAGLATGFDNGLVCRIGETTGGTDVIVRIFKKYFGISMGRSLLLFDVAVLLLSSIYIGIKRMMYTLIVPPVLSYVVGSVLDGAYAMEETLIVSSHSEEIGQSSVASLEHGVTYLDDEGAYS